MKINTRRLGKGISELLNDKETFNDNELNYTPTLIPINLLYPNKFQPRKIFNEEKLKELSNSILINGIIQPILVRKISGKSGYEIIAGERRWRASIVAKLKDVPVIIKDLDNKKCLELSIIENIQREDLNVVEEAESYKNLINSFSYTHEELSLITGKSRSHITNILRILSLSEVVKNMITKKEISFGHARALVNVNNAEDIAKIIVSKDLSVRRTEQLIKCFNKNQKPEIKKSTEEGISELEKILYEHHKLNIKIVEKKGKGSIKIKFSTIYELHSILKKLQNS